MGIEIGGAFASRIAAFLAYRLVLQSKIYSVSEKLEMVTTVLKRDGLLPYDREMLSFLQKEIDVAMKANQSQFLATWRSPKYDAKYTLFSQMIIYLASYYQDGSNKFLEITPYFIKMLAQYGVPINANDGPSTPLVVAIKSYTGCEPSIIEAFINAGADVNLATSQGEYPILEALVRAINLTGEIARLYGEIVRLLVERGAQLNIYGNTSGSGFDQKTTPLHLAVSSDDQELTTFVLDTLRSRGQLGKVVDIEDSNGNTPLHIIVNQLKWISQQERNKVEFYIKTIQQLIQAGAHDDIKNNQDKTVWDLIDEIPDEALRKEITRVITHTVENP